MGGWPLPWYLEPEISELRLEWGEFGSDGKGGRRVVRVGVPPEFAGVRQRAGRGQGSQDWKEFSLTLHPSGRLAVFGPEVDLGAPFMG